MNAIEALDRYASKFLLLRVNRRSGRDASPHKICMLLAVLDMAQAGLLADNRITFQPPLLERYRRFFDVVRSPTDHLNPYFPFFHLQGSLRDGSPSFWHLCALPGREAVLAAMDAARSAAHVIENIAYASLDDDLHALLQNPEHCDRLSDLLAEHWFDRSRSELHTLLRRSAAISQYELSLRTFPTKLGARESPPPAYVRSPAFRRVVIEAYDYRCVATGERIITPSGEALVEAAHIHPFSQSADDDPRNGLALSRDMHWAMDRNLIAPGPDLKWHVSKTLDARIPDLRRLCQLEGQKLLLPSELRYAPKREALEWRLEKLRDARWAANEE